MARREHLHSVAFMARNITMTIIGRAFTNGHSVWHCTDIDTRTVVAIRLDHAQITWVEVRGGRCGPETLAVIDPRTESSWFNGPPYALAETVFDECDSAALRPVTEDEVTNWRPKQERG